MPRLKTLPQKYKKKKLKNLKQLEILITLDQAFTGMDSLLSYAEQGTGFEVDSIVFTILSVYRKSFL